MEMQINDEQRHEELVKLLTRNDSEVVDDSSSESVCNIFCYSTESLSPFAVRTDASLAGKQVQFLLAVSNYNKLTRCFSVLAPYPSFLDARKSFTAVMNTCGILSPPFFPILLEW